MKKLALCVATLTFSCAGEPRMWSRFSDGRCYSDLDCDSNQRYVCERGKCEFDASYYPTQTASTRPSPAFEFKLPLAEDDDVVVNPGHHELFTGGKNDIVDVERIETGAFVGIFASRSGRRYVVRLGDRHIQAYDFECKFVR